MNILNSFNTVKYLIAPFVKLFDRLYEKSDDFWGFAVHHIKSEQFIENARAIFESVKSEKAIKKIIFTRDNNSDYFIEDAVNFEVVNIKSARGIYLLMRCKVLFVTHSISMDYSLRYDNSKFVILKLNMTKRLVVNLWHGIPLKKLYAIWNPAVRKRLDRVPFRRYERTKYAGLVCSSDIDSFAMGTMFYPIRYENLWITGLPRNDFLKLNEDQLPKYLKDQVTYIQKLKCGRRLILYAPTYRQTSAVASASYYQFSHEEIVTLKTLLKKHNAVFGFRMHYFRNNLNLFNMESFVDNEFIFDLGHQNVSEIAPLIREADIVVSDYSSVFIEALYLDKPVFAFTYDFENYSSEQDGILYDFNMIFPGPFDPIFVNLLNNIDEELTFSTQTKTVRYETSKKFFYKFDDFDNSKRVVERVKAKTCLL